MCEKEDKLEEIEDGYIANLISELMVKNKLTEENFSFFYYNIDTKKYYFFNENKWFVAASTSKVPIAMLYYDKINAGEITENTTYTYTSNAYEEGSGQTAYKYKVGNKIPVSYLLEQMIVNSDNTATNILSISLGGRKKYRQNFGKYTDDELPNDFNNSNIISASVGFDIMKYLYNNKEDYQELLQYMKYSSYEEYLKKYIKESDVSHKYGSYNGYVHDYGIVYGETTYLVGIFTKNVVNAKELIENTSKEILDYTLKKEE